MFVKSFSQTPTAEELVKIHSVSDSEMNAIANPIEGSYIYNTTSETMHYYNGTDWAELLASTSTVYVGHFIISGTGSQTISGIPFQPSSITFTAHANIESTSINSDNNVGNNNNAIPNTFGIMNGYARNDLSQQVMFVGGSGNSINDISRYANANQCIGIRYTNNNGDNLGLTTANLTAVNNDGFTINVSSRVDNLLVMYTAYK